MTSRVPDLATLRLLVSVARLGSIGAAAREAGISQQSASERMRAVEAQTGLTLLRRGPRGSRLTESGGVLVEWANRLLDLSDEIDTAIDTLRGDRRRELTVWSSMSVAESLLPRWLVLLRKRQEAEGVRPTTVTLRATNSSAVVDGVRRGRADLGFVEGARAPSGVRSTTLRNDELVLVAPADSPLARRRRPLSAVQVAALELTGREVGSGTREVLEQAFARVGLDPPTAVVELTTATAVREAVLAGSPPAFLSRLVVARELESGHLVQIRVHDLEVRRSLRAVWSGGATPPSGPVRNLVGIARAPGSR